MTAQAAGVRGAAGRRHCDVRERQSLEAVWNGNPEEARRR
jgi:hypothetical protein